MDPGQSLLQRLKEVPNLINEDPSITTPKNTAFVDLPWSDFAKLVDKDKRKAKQRITQSRDTTDKQDAMQPEDKSLGNWDSTTGYQDKDHEPKS